VRIALPADGASDAKRLRAELQKKQQEIEFLEGKLSNPDFTGKAPPAVVAKERARLLQAQQAAERLRGLLGETAELG
jgi:valyl-tRNA synthetase